MFKTRSLNDTITINNDDKDSLEQSLLVHDDKINQNSVPNPDSKDRSNRPFRERKPPKWMDSYVVYK